MHDRDAVGERQRLDLVVGDVDHGVGEPLVEPLDLDAQLGAQLGVEVGERLVEEEDVDVAHQRPADRDALALAAGQLGRLALRAAARSGGSRRRARRGVAISSLGTRATRRPKVRFPSTVICG